MASQPIDKENNKRDNKMNKSTNHNKNNNNDLNNIERKVKKCIPNANRRAAGSNWQLANDNNNNVDHDDNNSDNVKKITTNEMNDAIDNMTVEKSKIDADKQEQKKCRRKRNKWGNKHVAMDCEMVGIGLKGDDDMLARVSIVNRHGNVLMDKYVKPTAVVTDYRTCVSGIRPADIENGENFNHVQQQVIDMLQGRILVGHGLRKDLAVLKITHPFCNIRDTSSYKPLARLVANGRTPSLKRLVHCLLGQQIQTGEHDSVEDARAAMNIYNSCSKDWEEYLQRKMR